MAELDDEIENIEIHSLTEMFIRICQSLEKRVHEKECLLLFNLTNIKDFERSPENTEHLTEVFHILSIPKDDGYNSEERVEILIYFDEYTESFIIIAEGVLPHDLRTYRNEMHITNVIERRMYHTINGLIFHDEMSVRMMY